MDQPVREGTATTPDGVTVAFAEWGEPAGPLVVGHHGTPGCRWFGHPEPGAERRAGVRYVAYDRPGYGRSPREPGRRVAAAAAHAAAIADELGVERFAVIGVSGGGPHALACAALLPDRVLRAALLVTPAPSDDPEIDFLAGQNDWNRHEFTVAAESEERFREEFAGEAQAVLDDPDRFVQELAAGLPEVDRRMLERPDVRAHFRDVTVEAFRPGIDGWFDDDRAFLSPWDVPLEAIRCPVRIWQGALDVLAPRAHGERVAALVPGASLEVVPDAGHLLVDAHLEALAWLAGGD